ncbi:MmcB family DNA repair protein [Kaistia granuli]|uniref:MmcB family DNA repair protein n=1 Tax=Kaistia granuli TaxID=363259 RepID=UPI00037CDAB9|nr:MmcB family DNA repair protein [Kaistia granuli]
MVYSPTLAVPRDGRQSDTALAIQRGVGRLFRARGHAIVTELVLATGRRADVIALGPAGEITIVEIKSSIADFRTDGKWPDYAPYCDRLYFASHAGVPAEIFPEAAGLILADAYGAEILREAPHAPLVAARRKAMMLRFAQAAAHRLHGLFDPDAGFHEII